MELRPLREDDLAPLARWLPRTAADLGCDSWASEDALRGAVGREEVLTAIEGDPAGLLTFEVGAPRKDAAQIQLLAIDPDRRRLGIGSRAALALEERLAGAAASIYILVPAKLGLAFYFWLRLGYQPLTQAGWPLKPPHPPSAWLVRQIG